jgi:hypothetical protein
MKFRHFSSSYARRPWWGWLTEDGWIRVLTVGGCVLYLIAYCVWVAR